MEHINPTCDNCHVPKSTRFSYCSLCQAMLDAVSQQPGLVRAHDQWVLENEKLMQLKQQLMGGGRSTTQ